MLRWAECKAEKASEHEDAENWHSQQGVDKDKGEDSREGTKHDQFGAKEAAVRELVASKLSKNMGREWRYVADAPAHGFLDLRFDNRV